MAQRFAGKFVMRAAQPLRKIHQLDLVLDANIRDRLDLSLPCFNLSCLLRI
jgi:hypothetical protein